MAKSAKVQFVCTDCGMNFNQWQGQCKCGAWNTLVEMKIPKSAGNNTHKRAGNNTGYAGLMSGGSKKDQRNRSNGSGKKK
jgi:DNA repair protein RadA/Sms